MPMKAERARQRLLDERLHKRHSGTEIRAILIATVDLSTSINGQVLALGREIVSREARSETKAT